MLNPPILDIKQLNPEVETLKIALFGGSESWDTLILNEKCAGVPEIVRIQQGTTCGRQNGVILMQKTAKTRISGLMPILAKMVEIDPFSVQNHQFGVFRDLGPKITDFDPFRGQISSGGTHVQR